MRDSYASLVLSDEFNVLATSKVGTQVLPGFSYMAYYYKSKVKND